MRGHISQARVGGGGGVATMLLTWSRPIGNALAMGRLFSQPDLEENSMVSMQGAEPRGGAVRKIIRLVNFLSVTQDGRKKFYTMS